jgi:hypothetical protein
VSANPDGTISVSAVTSPAGVPYKWREIAPFIWRQEGEKQLLSVKVADGRVTRFSFGEGSPFEVFDRTPAWESSTLLLPLLAIGCVALLLNSLAWPISALTRRHYGGAYRLQGTEAKAHRLVRIASIAALVVLIGWVTVIFTVMSTLYLIPRMTGWIVLLETLAPVAFFGGVALGLWNAWVVLRGQRRWYAKLWALVLAASFLVVLWVALAFHLISFRTLY